jgi:hypothetical protein
MQLVAKDRWVKIAWLLTSYSTTIAISSFRYESPLARYVHGHRLTLPPSAITPVRNHPRPQSPPSAITSVRNHLSANYDHYTWWSIASFSIYALLGLGDVEHLYFWLIVGIQLQVVLGKKTVSCPSFTRHAYKFKLVLMTQGLLLWEIFYVVTSL